MVDMLFEELLLASIAPLVEPEPEQPEAVPDVNESRFGVLPSLLVLKYREKSMTPSWLSRSSS